MDGMVFYIYIGRRFGEYEKSQTKNYKIEKAVAEVNKRKGTKQVVLLCTFSFVDIQKIKTFAIYT